MGNCCAANSNDGEVKMQKTTNAKQLTALVLDDREVLGLRGEEKLSLIIKIQSLIRGSLARKRIRQVHGFQTKNLSKAGFGTKGEPNYHNEKV